MRFLMESYWKDNASVAWVEIAERHRRVSMFHNLKKPSLPVDMTMGVSLPLKRTLVYSTWVIALWCADLLQILMILTSESFPLKASPISWSAHPSHLKSSSSHPHSHWSMKSNSYAGLNPSWHFPIHGWPLPNPSPRSKWSHLRSLHRSSN